MLRALLLLLAIAMLAGCSKAPGGNALWLTQPTPDQHSLSFFPIKSGPHAVDCNSCHGTSDTFRDFDCLTCHQQTPTNAGHVKVGGYAYSSPSCFVCHPDGTKASGVDHTPLFPVGAGQVHAIGAPAVHVAGTIQCSSCHVSTAQRARVDCTVCHGATDQSTKHSGLIGPEPNSGPPLWSGIGAAPAGESANCLLCHALGGLQPVATHAQSLAQPVGFPIAGGNHFQSCELCHTAQRTDPARKNPELDFAAANCANCHAQALDFINTKHTFFGVDLTTPPATTATCLTCHPNGGTAANFNHTFFPIAASDVHALSAPAVHVPGTISCASCHTPATSGDYAKVDCTVCHTSSSMQPLHVAVSDLPATYASPDPSTFATSGLCLKCHADSTVPISVAMSHVPPVPSHAPFLVSSGAPHYQKSCLACHVAARTDKTWATDFTKPERCTGCHTDPITSASHFGSYSGYPGTYSYSDAACLSCHPAGHMGPFDHTSGFPIAANDVHHSSVAACTSCHTNTSTPTNLTTINCVGCHSNSTASVDPGGIDSRHTTPHLPVTIAGYSWDSLSCLKCHAGTVAAPAWTDPLKFTLAQHSSSCFDIIGGTHSVSQMNGTTPICFTCHNTMNAAAKTWGINWAQGQCAPCHNDGRTATCR